MYEGETKASNEYADVPERASSQLPLSHQEKAIAELHENISQLSSRLKPVLTPDSPSDNVKEGVEAKPVQSPLASQLAANNNGISMASRKLRMLMERLEC